MSHWGILSQDHQAATARHSRVTDFETLQMPYNTVMQSRFEIIAYHFLEVKYPGDLKIIAVQAKTTCTSQLC